MVIELDRFEGPLDLLLHLIREQEFDIFDIPIATITDQFLAALQRIRREDLDSAGEFLEMAATLVGIKAQMLLPGAHGEEEEDPRAELVRRLLEYEQIREIGRRLEAAEAERARRFGKGFVQERPRPEPEDTPLETEWEDVFAAALEVRLPDPRDPEHRLTRRPVAMEEKIELILETLRTVARVEFSKLVHPWAERTHGVMTFLASLELGRRRVVRLRQSRPFSELWLYREEDAGESGSTGDPGIESAGEPGVEPVDESDRAPLSDPNEAPEEW